MKEEDRIRWEKADRLTALSRGYQASQVLIAANRLGIFAAVGEGEATAEEVAERAGTDPRATKLLLDALVGLQLLEKRRPSPPSGSASSATREGPSPSTAPPSFQELLLTESYRSSPDALEFLIPGKPWSTCDILRHDGRLYDRWSKLTDTVRSGQPAQLTHRRRSAGEQRDFILGMANVGVRSARLLGEHLDLGNRRAFLDVGGGPGTYAAVFCQNHPQLRATLFDLPETIAIAREHLRARTAADRIELVEGDFLRDPLPPGHDVALLSNIVHSLPPEKNQFLIEKIHGALDPGGLLVIKDFRLDDDRAHPSRGSLFAINMLLATEGGRAYTDGEMTGWLCRAGFGGVRTAALTEVSTLVMGERAG